MKQTKVLNPRGFPDFWMSMYCGMYPTTGAKIIKIGKTIDLMSIIVQVVLQSSLWTITRPKAAILKPELSETQLVCGSHLAMFCGGRLHRKSPTLDSPYLTLWLGDHPLGLSQSATRIVCSPFPSLWLLCVGAVRPFLVPDGSGWFLSCDCSVAAIHRY